MMADKRISQRYATRVDVIASTVVDARQACIVDISRHGAKIEIAQPFAPDDVIALELADQRLTAVVTWTETDRMGVRFETPLQDGAFADALNAAARQSSFLQSPADGRRGAGTGFGRRAS